MVSPKRNSRRSEDKVSKSRALNAFFLTILSLLVVVVWGFHSVWAIKVIIYRPYGNILNNLMFGPGTLIANAGLSARFISYLNRRLLDEKIDADHKKYI